MTWTTEQRTQIENLARKGIGAAGPTVSTDLRVEIRDMDERRRIFGRAVPYNVEIDLGFFRETMLPGVFAKSITEGAKGLPLLVGHQSSDLRDIAGVSERWEDNKRGLDGVWLLDDDEVGRTAASKIETGSLGFMSVGFQPVNGERGSTHAWDDDDVLHVSRKEARLLEVSLTPTPAYRDAVITKIRALTETRAPGTPRIDRWRSFLAGAR